MEIVSDKLNSRQLQSLETKNRIYEVALRKFTEKSLDEVTIASICKEAGVSVGSFYNYFDSKEAIIYENFRRADMDFTRFEQVDQEGLDTLPLILDYMDYYISFVSAQDLNFIKHLYTTSNHYFIMPHRPMQEVLKTILRRRQVQINPEFMESSEELVDQLFMTARGVIFHWCLHEGRFNIRELARKHFLLILKNVLIEEKER
jgi:AcrR family transcriptional regulator